MEQWKRREQKQVAASKTAIVVGNSNKHLSHKNQQVQQHQHQNKLVANSSSSSSSNSKYIVNQTSSNSSLALAVNHQQQVATATAALVVDGEPIKSIATVLKQQHSKFLQDNKTKKEDAAASTTSVNLSQLKNTTKLDHQASITNNTNLKQRYLKEKQKSSNISPEHKQLDSQLEDREVSRSSSSCSLSGELCGSERSGGAAAGSSSQVDQGNSYVYAYNDFVTSAVTALNKDLKVACKKQKQKQQQQQQQQVAAQLAAEIATTTELVNNTSRQLQEYQYYKQQESATERTDEETKRNKKLSLIRGCESLIDSDEEDALSYILRQHSKPYREHDLLAQPHTHLSHNQQPHSYTHLHEVDSSLYRNNNNNNYYDDQCGEDPRFESHLIDHHLFCSRSSHPRHICGIGGSQNDNLNSIAARLRDESKRAFLLNQRQPNSLLTNNNNLRNSRFSSSNQKDFCSPLDATNEQHFDAATNKLNQLQSALIDASSNSTHQDTSRLHSDPSYLQEELLDSARTISSSKLTRLHNKLLSSNTGTEESVFLDKQQQQQQQLTHHQHNQRAEDNKGFLGQLVVNDSGRLSGDQQEQQQVSFQAAAGAAVAANAYDEQERDPLERRNRQEERRACSKAREINSGYLNWLLCCFCNLFPTSSTAIKQLESKSSSGSSACFAHEFSSNNNNQTTALENDKKTRKKNKRRDLERQQQQQLANTTCAKANECSIVSMYSSGSSKQQQQQQQSGGGASQLGGQIGAYYAHTTTGNSGDSYPADMSCAPANTVTGNAAYHHLNHHHHHSHHLHHQQHPSSHQNHAHHPHHLHHNHNHYPPLSAASAATGDHSSFGDSSLFANSALRMNAFIRRACCSKKCLFVSCLVLILFIFIIVIGLTAYLNFLINFNKLHLTPLSGRFKVDSKADSFTDLLANRTSKDFLMKQQKYETILRGAFDRSSLRSYHNHLVKCEVYSFKPGSLWVYFRLFINKRSLMHDTQLMTRKSHDESMDDQFLPTLTQQTLYSGFEQLIATLKAPASSSLRRTQLPSTSDSSGRSVRSPETASYLITSSKLPSPLQGRNVFGTSSREQQLQVKSFDEQISRLMPLIEAIDLQSIQVTSDFDLFQNINANNLQQSMSDNLRDFGGLLTTVPSANVMVATGTSKKVPEYELPTESTTSINLPSSSTEKLAQRELNLPAGSTQRSNSGKSSEDEINVSTKVFTLSANYKEGNSTRPTTSSRASTQESSLFLTNQQKKPNSASASGSQLVESVLARANTPATQAGVPGTQSTAATLQSTYATQSPDGSGQSSSSSSTSSREISISSVRETVRPTINVDSQRSASNNQQRQQLKQVKETLVKLVSTGQQQQQQQPAGIVSENSLHKHHGKHLSGEDEDKFASSNERNVTLQLGATKLDQHKVANGTGSSPFSSSTPAAAAAATLPHDRRLIDKSKSRERNDTLTSSMPVAPYQRGTEMNMMQRPLQQQQHLNRQQQSVGNGDNNSNSPSSSSASLSHLLNGASIQEMWNNAINGKKNVSVPARSAGSEQLDATRVLQPKRLATAPTTMGSNSNSFTTSMSADPASSATNWNKFSSSDILDTIRANMVSSGGAQVTASLPTNGVLSSTISSDQTSVFSSSSLSSTDRQRQKVAPHLKQGGSLFSATPARQSSFNSAVVLNRDLSNNESSSSSQQVGASATNATQMQQQVASAPSNSARLATNSSKLRQKPQSVGQLRNAASATTSSSASAQVQQVTAKPIISTNKLTKPAKKLQAGEASSSLTGAPTANSTLINSKGIKIVDNFLATLDSAPGNKTSSTSHLAVSHSTNHQQHNSSSPSRDRNLEAFTNDNAADQHVPTLPTTIELTRSVTVSTILPQRGSTTQQQFSSLPGLDGKELRTFDYITTSPTLLNHLDSQLSMSKAGATPTTNFSNQWKPITSNNNNNNNNDDETGTTQNATLALLVEPTRSAANNRTRTSPINLSFIVGRDQLSSVPLVNTPSSQGSQSPFAMPPSILESQVKPSSSHHPSATLRQQSNSSSNPRLKPPTQKLTGNAYRASPVNSAPSSALSSSSSASANDFESHRMSRMRTTATSQSGPSTPTVPADLVSTAASTFKIDSNTKFLDDFVLVINTDDKLLVTPASESVVQVLNANRQLSTQDSSSPLGSQIKTITPLEPPNKTRGPFAFETLKADNIHTASQVDYEKPASFSILLQQQQPQQVNSGRSERASSSSQPNRQVFSNSMSSATTVVDQKLLVRKKLFLGNGDEESSTDLPSSSTTTNPFISPEYESKSLKLDEEEMLMKSTNKTRIQRNQNQQPADSNSLDLFGERRKQSSPSYGVLTTREQSNTQQQQPSRLISTVSEEDESSALKCQYSGCRAKDTLKFTCLNYTQICDDFIDCQDESDELDCVSLLKHDTKSNKLSFSNGGGIIYLNRKGSLAPMCIDYYSQPEILANSDPSRHFLPSIIDEQDHNNQLDLVRKQQELIKQINTIGQYACNLQSFSRLVSVKINHHDLVDSFNLIKSSKLYHRLSLTGDLHDKSSDVLFGTYKATSGNPRHEVEVVTSSECPSQRTVFVKCGNFECGQDSFTMLDKNNHSKRKDGNIINDFPWLVKLYWMGYLSCHGYLIDELWLISSGECFANRSLITADGAFDANGWTAEISYEHYGNADYQSIESNRRTIKNILIQPKYKNASQTIESAIVLAKLEKPVRFSPLNRPICLPLSTTAATMNSKTFSMDKAYEDCVTATLPILAYNSTTLPTQDLLLSKVKFHNQKDCLKSEQNERLEDLICVSDLLKSDVSSRIKKEDDTTRVLICSVSTESVQSRSRWTVVGVQSKVHGQNLDSDKQLFTTVSSHMDWIVNTMNPVGSTHYLNLESNLSVNELNPVNNLVVSQNQACNRFKCSSGECLSWSRICDGLYDCSSHEDEKDCH